MMQNCHFRIIIFILYNLIIIIDALMCYPIASKLTDMVRHGYILEKIGRNNIFGEK